MAYLRFQFRRDLANIWSNVNPVLAEGELGLEKDSTKFKLGDGIKTWNQLPYVGIEGPAGPTGSPGIGIVSGGTTGQALVKASDDDYDTTWSTISANPGGSDTQIQFNDNGSFAGDSGFVFNKVYKSLVIGGGIVTTSQPVLDLSQTWNNAAVTFTGLKLNVTDTASNASSLLMDLQVGGASRFGVSKTGALLGPNAAFEIRPFSTNSFEVWLGSQRQFQLNYSQEALKIARDYSIQWNSQAADVNNVSDTFLRRRAAANLQLGAADAAAPVAQTLSVQSVVAGTTNTAGADFTIDGSQGTGTGAGGSIVFRVAPAGSSGTAQNALATALTIASDKSVQMASGSFIRGGNQFYSAIDLAPGGAASSLSFFYGNVGFSPGSAIVMSLASSYDGGFDGPRIVNGIGFTTRSSRTSLNQVDVILLRDAANTLALRNGTAAQTARIYGSFTSASVYKRLSLSSTTTVATVAAETDTGDMDLALTPAGAGNVRYGTHADIGAETITGYIEIKDAGGTVRKLAVVS
jgi:hypothetical protein